MFFFLFLFSDGEFRDRKMIFRDETDLVFFVLSCLVKFPTQRRASSNPANRVCLFFFLLFTSYRFSIFSRSNAHTHANKEGANTRGKAEKRQRAVRFTRFLDRMFYSGRLFTFIQTFIVLQRGYHHARRLTKMKINKMHQSLCNIKIHYD